MRALLDTHTFLWWITDDARLSALGRQVIAAAENEIYLSAASVWEMTIKVGKGRLILPAPPAEFIASRMLQSRFRPLPVQTCPPFTATPSIAY
jgi:PIN domain nuclease of toxin-antitoxin system